ncbi:MAG: guanine deaminase [Alphaproteobacteria bacterium]|nr:MAG: guanine deaminase [Alphaproteobacteria bacterium]
MTAPGKPEGMTALRGTVVTCRDDPFLGDPDRALAVEIDGIVLCRDGVIEAVGPASELLGSMPSGADVVDYSGCLIAPGFIDTHVHYVQTEIVASYGTQLLDWLDRYAFPAELAFEDPAHAATMARVFCDELLRNGTTTALVFCAVYPQSVEALFAEAERRGMRVIAGKVLMDRNAPEKLRDTAQQGYDASKALIARWHGRGRCLYAITPRFAGTSTPAQLDAAGALWREHPDVFVHTHIAENRREIDWTADLFPERKNYLDIYDHHGLIGRRAVLAHGVHLSEDEICRCHESGTALAHCPTSNLFLGSGLFRIAAMKDARRPVHVGLGTDIGGGTSFSLLATMGAAYQVAQLNGRPLRAVEAFYLATLGGARALALDDRIGSIAPGHEADLVVLDPHATPLLALRDARSESIEDTLFALMMLGDDRAVRATYVAGKPAHPRDA